VAVAAVVVGAGLVMGRGRADGPPLDPASTGPLGTRALVELAQRFGAEVSRDLPGEGTDVVLVLTDRLDQPARDRLAAFARAGGRLVVADPGSRLAPAVAGVLPGPLARGACSVGAVADLGAVEAATIAVYRPEPGDLACFTTDQGAWLVVRSDGAGTRVMLGGAGPLVNENLGRGDNAAVATALLAPRPGTRVAVVYDPVAGATGDLTPLDLVPPQVWWALAQLAVAFGVYVAWRARRFGRPVPEAQPVELPGSLLVRARGDLYRRSRSHARAATQLRRRTEAVLRSRAGLPPAGPFPVAEVAARLGMPPAELEQALAPPGDRAPGPRDLTAYAAGLDALVDRLGPLNAHQAGDPR
jgi:hypothetical protein